MSIRKDLPRTVARSSQRAQETFIKAHDSAVETYGEGERAHRTAFAALKHSFEKAGDHWDPKSRPGASDEQAARGRGQRRGKTAGGVDANASKAHLMDIARRLEIRGRSRMTKQELINAIDKANQRQTRAARNR